MLFLKTSKSLIQTCRLSAFLADGWLSRQRFSEIFAFFLELICRFAKRAATCSLSLWLYRPPFLLGANPSNPSSLIIGKCDGNSTVIMLIQRYPLPPKVYTPPCIHIISQLLDNLSKYPFPITLHKPYRLS